MSIVLIRSSIVRQGFVCLESGRFYPMVFLQKLVFMGKVKLERGIGVLKIFCPSMYFSSENIIYGILSFLWGRGDGQFL